MFNCGKSHIFKRLNFSWTPYFRVPFHLNEHASSCKILRARASEQLCNFCKQFEQRPNFASTLNRMGPFDTHSSITVTQRSKLTFSKSHLLATFNCKMVAITKMQPPENTWRGDTSGYITRKANSQNCTFSTLHFATVREREGRDCLVAKTIYFNVTKLLRPGNIANGAQNPFKMNQICHFELQLI